MIWQQNRPLAFLLQLAAVRFLLNNDHRKRETTYQLYTSQSITITPQSFPQKRVNKRVCLDLLRSALFSRHYYRQLFIWANVGWLRWIHRDESLLPLMPSMKICFRVPVHKRDRRTVELRAVDMHCIEQRWSHTSIGMKELNQCSLKKWGDIC